jgi:VWFA-related protein
MTRALTASLCFTVAALTVSLQSGATVHARGAETVRTVYFSALDDKGAPVTDLAPADLTVKEGGKAQTVASLKAATEPMQVAIIVDDGGTGVFQMAVAQLLETMQQHGQFAISALSPQAQKLVDFTQDANPLRTAIGQLGQRGRVTPDGEQIIDAVADAANQLEKRNAARPVIIVMTVHGETAQSDRADSAMKAITASGASLSVVYATGLELGRVLGDGPKQSGGFTDRAGGSQAAGEAVMKMANNLMHQYALTYNLPDGAKTNDKLELKTTRKGVTLFAPSRLADK